MNENEDQGSDFREPTELELLKSRAKQMGIVHSNNIGLEALRAKITAKQEGKPDVPDSTDKVNTTDLVTEGVANKPLTDDRPNEDLVAQMQAQMAKLSPAVAQAPVVNALSGVDEAKPVKKMNLNQYMRQEQMKLVRLRITCMDPKKKDLQGEIFTVANEYLGTVKKFVPFGEFTDDGFHVPFCIYKLLDGRKFLNIRTTKDRRTGQIKVETNWAKEFALEVLEPLSQEELNRLAISQAAAGSLNA